MGVSAKRNTIAPQTLMVGKNKAAMSKCPTGVIIYRGRTAPESRQPSKKPAEKIST